MHTRTPFLRPLLGALLALAATGALRAQFELKSTTGNRLFLGPVPTMPSDTPPLQPGQPQFAGFGETGAVAGPIAATGTLQQQYPSAVFTDSGTGAPTGGAIVLVSGRMGNGFAGGVPRYLLGEVIAAPETQFDGVTVADASYWRREPVKPGETFVHPQGAQDASPPLAANSVLTYYYSPHAERVFAKQSGRVTVLWVTRVPVAIPGDAQLRYRYKEDNFAVSSATQKPVRPMYWTEKSFNSPVVSVPTGSVEAVNPVYTTGFPALVAEEYKPVGISVNPNANASVPGETRTFWFEKVGGTGSLHAYNIEGRILIEYLGALQPGSSSVHVFLGADIVEVARAAPSVNTTVLLGEQITPRDTAGRLLPEDGGPELVASPLLAAALDGKSYYGSSTRADGTRIFYAERENDNPDRVIFYWLQNSVAAIHFLPAPATPNFSIAWPLQRNNYTQIWPSNPTQFQAHYTVASGGSTVATSLQFANGQLPQVIFQDDPTQTEAVMDLSTQRLGVTLSGDGLNRTLLKFTSGTQVWYVRLYTQSDERAGYQEGDGAPVINTTATVGQRINPPAGYSFAGYIASGSGYNPLAYRDPFAVGALAAEQGAIIPVNAVPGDKQLEVWWFKKITPPSAAFSPVYVPAKVGRYTVSYPASPEKIILASNSGTGDLSPSEIAGSLYIQNDRNLPGFNPNEEHALMLNGRAYALRDDLNNTSSSPTAYTSEPFVLVNYTSPADGRPAMHAFKVEREVDLSGDANDILFNYPVVAGTILQGPMPLPLLPLPVDAKGEVLNAEVDGTPDSAHLAGTGSNYEKFTFEDRKGYSWVYRGPHANASPTFGMQFYYPMRAGFYVPGVATQPAVGAPLPYLRPLDEQGAPEGDPVSGEPLTVIYRPVWPDRAPELRVAETLTLPKFGLPALLNQSSAQIIYQQSIAKFGPTKPAVTLHDPIREKVFALGKTGKLDKLPSSLLTQTKKGKLYFQSLAPHLQERFFFDPSRGTKGSLVLIGEFVDEVAGDDFLRLNVLSNADIDLLKGLLPAETPADSTETKDIRAKWSEAISSLLTRVETFEENPAKPGTFRVASGVDFSGTQLPVVKSSDEAVVDYALTATGQGEGWVTLVFGNGSVFTPGEEPVSVSVLRVAPRLYNGELKVQLSGNPLDEQVTLHHSGDFAAKPDDYEFEWRYAPPADGVAPATYLFGAKTSRLADSWMLVQNPAGVLPTSTEYTAAPTVSLPRTVQVVNSAYTGAGILPGIVLRSPTGVDFSAGVPATVYVTAQLGDFVGFVLYVNGVPALAHEVASGFSPTAAQTGLVNDAPPKQFTLSGGYFNAAVNKIEVALYSTAVVGTSSFVDFKLYAASETDKVAEIGSPWTAPNGTLSNLVIVGGSPTAPLGGPLLVMSDNYFTMRYRPKASANSVAGTGWSRWTTPKLVEGWIKRVLAGINPFNQRVTDLATNAVNTDVSLLTQAGTRWEGDIALSLDAINDVGLIAIYETVLNRAKKISIDSGIDYGAANDALLLAAGYLNDLYTILGNEAYADAANPTISVDDSGSSTEVNTSRFSFEGQVASVLDEELALLRGRDDFLSPSITTAPAYNRLYWNYTRGINSGEALYAVNYNIREKVGSSTADGKLDAADAQRMFPQGHGDAYGHYLTALTGYYKLLRSPAFTWTPRTEAVSVLGQAVQIDYFDERKFAAAAANVASTATQIISLVQRQSYKDDPGAGWLHLRDGKTNASTGASRQWGLDEWTSRSIQGAYYHWVVGNAILPDKDNNPNHTGVQIIDRTTVPALNQLTADAAGFQTTIDNANSRLNPLGLSPNAIAFDISPSELKSGKSHYEQIYERSLRAVLNAKGAFDQAAKMTRLLRNQENQLDQFNVTIDDQEGAFEDALVDLYGTPYSGDIGPGKTYAQGYEGPDLTNWFIVDRATDLVDTSSAVTVTLRVPVNIKAFSGFTRDNVTNAQEKETALKTVTIAPDQIAQFSTLWPSTGTSGTATLGARRVTGALQQAVLDQYQAQVDLRAAVAGLQVRQETFLRSNALIDEMITANVAAKKRQGEADSAILDLVKTQTQLTRIGNGLLAAGDNLRALTAAAVDYFPKVVGISNDVLSGTRGTLTLIGIGVTEVMVATGNGLLGDADSRNVDILNEEQKAAKRLEELAYDFEQKQVIFEWELQFRDLMNSHYEIAQLATACQRAAENLRNTLVTGDRLQRDLEDFRKRAAAIVQGYRTKDVTFRAFRNEALEQYRSLYDLAARYTYLAAKAYDYETGLLGSTAGQSVINNIVAARSLGDLTGGTPQATVSTLGDSGLAGTMARMQADWSVAKGRLGINNPDQNGTLFSIRRELFRLLDDAASTDAAAAWQQTLEQHVMTNVMADPDVAAQCRTLANADGSPVPGIVIPFSTTIQDNLNFFGLPLAAGDHVFSPSNFSTKIYSVGVVLPGYVGMDPYRVGVVNAGTPVSNAANSLSATPYVYLIPTGTDYMSAPPLGDTGAVRAWDVKDQALPLPFNLGATAFSTTQFFNANGTLSEQPWILRKHQAFRPVQDAAFFYSSIPAEFTNSRLVGRSAWNSGWKIVIPAKTLLNNTQDGLNRFVASVKDIELFLRTYSHSGN